VVLIPPRERAPLLQLGEDQIKITKKKGVTIVQVERARHIGEVEAVLAILAFEAWNIKAQGYQPNLNPGTWLPDLGLGWKGGFVSSSEPWSKNFILRGKIEQALHR
jgi:hypothetical protein